MEYVNLSPNWLEQQIRETREVVRAWPEWLREQASTSAPLSSDKLVNVPSNTPTLDRPQSEKK